MIVFSTKAEVAAFQLQARLEGKSIGFVPTMGALHRGHLALVDRAKAENDVVICSIFVNPTQFDNPEDLRKYPRTLQSDSELLATVACDVVFAPSADEMYDPLPQLSMHFGQIEEILEGQFRKGHFSGVGIVVSKLFHLTAPHRAYFGMKDLQQVAVVKRLVRDLGFNLEIVPCETVREADGLAMSSRNRRLSEAGRSVAGNVAASLKLAADILRSGGSVAEAKERVKSHFDEFSQFRLEYLEIIDFETFTVINEYNAMRKTAICIAIYLEEVRLIDNLVC